MSGVLYYGHYTKRVDTRGGGRGEGEGCGIVAIGQLCKGEGKVCTCLLSARGVCIPLGRKYTYIIPWVGVDQ